MKLLLDENLSRRIVPQLQDAYPGSSHVTEVGLERSADREVWEFAKAHDFVIVTSDADFEEMSLLRGPPPHVIWFRGGNLTSRGVLRLLEDNAQRIHEQFTAGTACVEIVRRQS